MSYTYSYISDALSSGLLFGVFSGVPTTLIGIATYVLSALGLYTIAKRRGLNHPWAGLDSRGQRVDRGFAFRSVPLCGQRGE